MHEAGGVRLPEELAHELVPALLLLVLEDPRGRERLALGGGLRHLLGLGRGAGGGQEATQKGWCGGWGWAVHCRVGREKESGVGGVGGPSGFPSITCAACRASSLEKHSSSSQSCAFGGGGGDERERERERPGLRRDAPTGWREREKEMRESAAGRHGALRRVEAESASSSPLPSFPFPSHTPRGAD